MVHVCHTVVRQSVDTPICRLVIKSLVISFFEVKGFKIHTPSLLDNV